MKFCPFNDFKPCTGENCMAYKTYVEIEPYTGLCSLADYAKNPSTKTVETCMLLHNPIHFNTRDAI